MSQPELMDFVRAIAHMVKVNPRMLDLARTQPTFPEVEELVVASIANAKDPADAMLAYENFGSLVPEWKFVFASETGSQPGFSVSRSFSDGSVVRSLFPTKRVLVLDRETHKDMAGNSRAQFPIDYSIAMDTQAFSYLAPFVEEKTSRIPDDFHEVFSFIAQENVSVDPIPYITENLPNILTKKNEIKRRLHGYEMLRTIDEDHFRETGRIRSTVSQSERDEKVEGLLQNMIMDASNPEVMAAALHDHSRLYCLLLKMVAIQLRRPQAEFATEKFSEFMEFMDQKLQTIFAREAIVAAEYFMRGQNNFGFFGKIQKGQPKNRKYLKNMAWDLCHIRHVELASTLNEERSNEPARRSRYFFSSLLTCDKDLIEVIDLYPLKSYAYKVGEYRPIPFADFDWIAKVARSKEVEAAFIEKYFARSEVKRRNEKRDAVSANLDGIIQELEEEFGKISMCA